MRRARHDVRRGALLGALLVALLLPLLALAGSPTASAAGTGRISGRMTAEDGSAVPGVVYGYRRDPVSGHWSQAEAEVTDATGRYTFASLPSDTYRLYFSPSGDFVPEFWNNVASLDEATDIVLAAGARVSRSAVLAPGARISGRLRDAAGMGIGRILVTAYRLDPSTGAWRPVTYSSSAADGTYTLRNLPPAGYRLGFQEVFAPRYLPEFWNDADFVYDATTIPVARGARVTGKNAVLAAASAIEGTVVDEAGDPIANAQVQVSRQPNEGRPGASGLAYTDPAGHYRIGGLRSGSFEVGFRSSDHIPEWWNDRRSGIHDRVEVAEGATVTGIDAELATSAHLVGRVTDEVTGAPVPGIWLNAWEWRNGYWDYESSVVSGPDGRYDAGGLSGGRVRLELRDPSGDHVSEFWPHRPSLETATDITVPAASTVSRNVSLSQAGRIDGQVVGTAEDGALSGVSVDVLSYDAARGRWRYVAGRETGADGRYDVGGLRPGTYRLRFTQWRGGGYLKEFWRNASSVETATDVVASAGSTISLEPARLDQGGHITGTVTGPEGTPLDDVHLTAFRYVDDADGQGFREVAEGSTAADGSYDLAGLAPGRYRIRFDVSSYETGASSEFWDGATSLADATDILVRGRSVVDGIDAELDLGGRLAGVVTGVDGTGLPGISVSVYRRSGSRFVREIGVGTDARGRYEVPNLTPGDYRIGFADDRLGAHAPEFWPDRTDLDSAQDVAIGAGSVVRRHVQLAPAAHVTGRVTGSDGEPVPGGVTVYPYRRDGVTGAWQRVPGQYGVHSASTDPSGAYDLGGLAPGTYRLELAPDLRATAREFWDDAATVADATDIVVGTGETAEGRDAELGTGAHVTGRVTDATGAPLDRIGVEAYTRDPVTGTWSVFTSAWTDELGRYDLGGLPAGTIRLGFRDGEGVLADEYWNNQPDLASAADIVVPAGGTVANRNAVLDTAGAVLAGTLLAADGDPVGGTVVLHRQGRGGVFAPYVSVPTGDWWDPEGAGGFRVPRLPPGSYRLEFDPDDPVLRTEFWDDAATLATATTITVTAGQRVTGLDPVLTAG